MIVSGTHKAALEKELKGSRHFWPGVPPSVQVFTLPAVTVIAWTRQELPSFHPVPRFFPGLPPASAALQGSRIVTRQEQPAFHPTPGTATRKPPFIPPPPGPNVVKGYIL